MPSLLVAFGAKSRQHALTAFPIGGTEPLDVVGGEAPPSDLAVRDPDHLPPVGLLGPVRLLPQLSGDQRETKQDRVRESTKIDARHRSFSSIVGKRTG